MLVRMKRLARIFTASAVVLAALGGAASAQATFPGRNGEIAYLDMYSADPDSTERDLYGVCPDGSGERSLWWGDAIGGLAFSPNGTLARNRRES
jgi:hypothetical protein